MNAIEASENLFKSIREVNEAYEIACSEINYYDAEYNDLTHALELTSFDEKKGYQLAMQLQQNRKARRAAKNERERLQPLYDLLRRDKGFTMDLSKAVAKVHTVAHRQSRRVYTPRVRDDISFT